MSRDLRTAALAAACVIAFAPTALAQYSSGYESSGPAASTTVKSSKSNTSDRTVEPTGNGTPGGTARATTVKSSKSNTSDRMGGGGGVRGAGDAK